MGNAISNVSKNIQSSAYARRQLQNMTSRGAANNSKSTISDSSPSSHQAPNTPTINPSVEKVNPYRQEFSSDQSISSQRAIDEARLAHFQEIPHPSDPRPRHDHIKKYVTDAQIDVMQKQNPELIQMLGGIEDKIVWKVEESAMPSLEEQIQVLEMLGADERMISSLYQKIEERDAKLRQEAQANLAKMGAANPQAEGDFNSQHKKNGSQNVVKSSMDSKLPQADVQLDQSGKIRIEVPSSFFGTPSAPSSDSQHPDVHQMDAVLRKTGLFPVPLDYVDPYPETIQFIKHSRRSTRLDNKVSERTNPTEPVSFSSQDRSRRFEERKVPSFEQNGVYDSPDETGSLFKHDSLQNLPVGLRIRNAIDQYQQEQERKEATLPGVLDSNQITYLLSTSLEYIDLTTFPIKEVKYLQMLQFYLQMPKTTNAPELDAKSGRYRFGQRDTTSL